MFLTMSTSKMKKNRQMWKSKCEVVKGFPGTDYCQIVLTMKNDMHGIEIM